MMTHSLTLRKEIDLFYLITLSLSLSLFILLMILCAGKNNWNSGMK